MLNLLARCEPEVQEYIRTHIIVARMDKLSECAGGDHSECHDEACECPCHDGE